MESGHSDDIDEILGVVLVDLFYQHERRIKAVVSDSVRNRLDRYLRLGDAALLLPAAAEYYLLNTKLLFL